MISRQDQVTLFKEKCTNLSLPRFEASSLKQLIEPFLVRLPASGFNKHKVQWPGDRCQVCPWRIFTLQTWEVTKLREWELPWPTELYHPCHFQASLISVSYHVAPRYNSLCECALAWLPQCFWNLTCVSMSPGLMGPTVNKENKQTSLYWTT